MQDSHTEPGAPDQLRVCILGGTGYVGTRLVAHLCGRGHRVRVPTRSAVRHRELNVLPTARLVQADIHDPAALAGLLAGCDVAINLVGILNEGRGQQGAGFRRSHSELAAKLVVACQQAKVSKLVQISALKADAETGPSHYLRSKGAAEQHIRNSEHLTWTILKPSVIFGPGDAFLNRFAGLLRLTPLVFPLACPDARFAPVHVANVVQAIYAVMTDAATNGRSYELCGREVYTLREIVTMVAATSSLRRRIIGLPDALARLQARVLEYVPGQPFTMDNYRSLRVASVCASEGLAELGIPPASLELNLRMCLGLESARPNLDSYRRAAGR